jgi:hypothetical protein
MAPRAERPDLRRCIAIKILSRKADNAAAIVALPYLPA